MDTLSKLWAINTHHIYNLLIKPNKHFSFIAVAEELSDTRKLLADWNIKTNPLFLMKVFMARNSFTSGGRTSGAGGSMLQMLASVLMGSL